MSRIGFYQMMSEKLGVNMVSNRTYHRLENTMAAIIDYRGKTPRKVSSGIPLITAKIVKEGQIKTPTEFIAEEDYVSWMRRGIPRSGDILVTTEAPLGEVAQLNHQRVALAQRLILLRGKSGILDNRFLKFLMQSEDVQDQLRARATGTTVLGIKQKELRQIELALPPIFEQRAIAHILGTLDDKIELNRRMNETLEEMARALFKSWFVDFDPVRSKMEGRDPGLPKHLADLFPNRLVDSELGPIPEGWEVKALSSFGEIVTGKTPSTKEAAYFGNDVPFLRIPDMHGKVYVLQTQMMLSNRGVSSQPQKTLPPDSVSVSCIATPGLVVLNHCTTQTNQQINSIIPWDRSLSRYIYWSCRQLSSEIKIGGIGGSVFGNMNKSTFSSLQVLNPERAIIQAFDQLVLPMHASILANEEQNQILSQVRDTLLPKLLSGELKVREVNRLDKASS